MQAKFIHKDDAASTGKAMEKKLDATHLLPKTTEVVTTTSQDDDRLDVMCYCMKGNKDDMQQDIQKWAAGGFIGFIICLAIGVSVHTDILLIMSMVGLGILFASIGFVVCKYACCHKP